MYFSYNGTCDWLKIKWHDQSCMKHEVVAFTAPFLPSIYEKWDYLSEFVQRKTHFLLFLCDTNPAYETPLNWLNLLGENLSNYKHGTLQ